MILEHVIALVSPHQTSPNHSEIKHQKKKYLKQLIYEKKN